MDAAEVKAELLRLLAEDPDVRATVREVATRLPFTGDDVSASSGPVAKAVQAVKAKVVPPWLQR